MLVVVGDGLQCAELKKSEIGPFVSTSSVPASTLDFLKSILVELVNVATQYFLKFKFV
jgi:hypothetical protein